MKIVLHHGDCVAVLKSYAEGSVGAVVCDPPYGLEFMGKDWDRLDAPVRRHSAKWEEGGGFTAAGLGGSRFVEWPSFSATTKHGTSNPTCAVCGGRLRGSKKCDCPKPHDHWKPMGKRRDPRNEGLPDHVTSNGARNQMSAMQEWHTGWLRETFRVLKPGGVIKAFGGTRTFHRLAAAMSEVGFTGIGLEAWTYGSGFPKSLDVSKAIDKTNGEAGRLHRFTAWMRTTGLTTRQINDATGTSMGSHYLNAGQQPSIPTPALWAVLRPLCGDIPPWVDALVDRIAAEREVIGVRSGFKAVSGVAYGGDGGWASEEIPITAPATDAAKAWEGWGTALKPAWEPVVVGWKPA